MNPAGKTFTKFVPYLYQLYEIEKVQTFMRREYEYIKNLCF